MKREDKIKLLRTISEGKRPEIIVCLLHTPEGVLDPDTGKHIDAAKIDEYFASIEAAHPLHKVVRIQVLRDEFDRINEEMEAKY